MLKVELVVYCQIRLALVIDVGMKLCNLVSLILLLLLAVFGLMVGP